jgi:sensor histidine kinase YesM
VFISLFTFAQYLLNRDAPYGWYSLYLLITAIWLWQSTRVWFNGIPQPANMTVFFAYMLLLGYGMMVSYIRFTAYLLDIPQQKPRLERWVRYFLRFAALSVLILLAELFVWNSLYVYILVNLLNYAGLLFLITNMLRNRHPLKRYALAASSSLLSGAITATLLNYIGPETTDRLHQMPLFYLVVCQLVEILCFSLALGRRSYLNKIEKVQVQQQLIQQLEENQRLQQTYTVELKRQLDQRTNDVLTKAHELEEQRVTQLQSDFVRRVAEAEMAGLRSQMNPHFIFNCLNSIKLYATENDSVKASDYLTKFSRLIRSVLENSRSERVTLRNELDMLQLYADMEIMRFKQKLTFSIEVEPGLDAQFVEIPPLLLQPYVENAIWHGLMHKSEGGTVHVRVTQPQEDLLQLIITDDGVGRARSTELKSKSASHRKSFGLKMTSERIALVNQLYQTHTQVTIEDLVDANGQPAGTEVVLQIPI